MIPDGKATVKRDVTGARGAKCAGGGVYHMGFRQKREKTKQSQNNSTTERKVTIRGRLNSLGKLDVLFFFRLFCLYARPVIFTPHLALLSCKDPPFPASSTTRGFTSR